MAPSCPSPGGKVPGSPVQKPSLLRSGSTKALLAQGEATPFSEHCRHYEDSYRRLQAETQSLKDQIQALHRDLTKHHSLIKAEAMDDILHASLQVDAQIASQYASVEGRRTFFQEIWEESYQRVANEQEIYEAQLHDLLQLRQENAYLGTIARQITPYIRSIAKVKERLEPRFQSSVDEQSENPQNMYNDSMNGETQARNDPVGVPEKREDVRANRKQLDSDQSHRRTSAEKQRSSQTQTEKRGWYPHAEGVPNLADRPVPSGRGILQHNQDQGV